MVTDIILADGNVTYMDMTVMNACSKVRHGDEPNGIYIRMALGVHEADMPVDDTCIHTNDQCIMHDEIPCYLAYCADQQPSPLFVRL